MKATVDGREISGHPRDADSQIVIHVRMLDRNGLQQKALGIVGVNLLLRSLLSPLQTWSGPMDCPEPLEMES